MLKEFVDERKSGLLFASRNGKPLSQSNILRRTLHPILQELGEPKCGMHAFRRFRVTHIRENGAPKDLEHFWMGHEGGSGSSLGLPEREGKEIGDIYSMLKHRLAYRRKWVEQLGLGFEIPSKNTLIGRNGRRIEVEPVLELAASA